MYVLVSHFCPFLALGGRCRSTWMLGMANSSSTRRRSSSCTSPLPPPAMCRMPASRSWTKVRTIRCRTAELGTKCHNCQSRANVSCTRRFKVSPLHNSRRQSISTSAEFDPVLAIGELHEGKDVLCPHQFHHRPGIYAWPARVVNAFDTHNNSSDLSACQSAPPGVS